MAKLEKTITGNFNEILHRIEDGIINGSVSASLEESATFVLAIPVAVSEFLKDTVIWAETE